MAVFHPRFEVDAVSREPLLGRLEAGPLLLAEFDYAGPVRLRQQAQERAIFRLILDGSCNERRGMTRLQCPSFSLVYHPPGSEWEDEIGPEGAHLFTIELEESWLDRVGRRRLPGAPMIDPRGGDSLWLSLQLYREYLRLPSTFSTCAMEGIVLGMLAAVARRFEIVDRQPGPRWFQVLIAEVHSRFTGDLTLTALAGASGVHPVHVSRVFQRLTGYTFSGYVHRLRAQYACQRLCRDETALSEIAADCGFSDQSHFTHVFRQISGITPAVLRKLLPVRRRIDAGALYPADLKVRPYPRPLHPIFASSGLDPR